MPFKPAGFGVQYTPPKKKKYTGPNVPGQQISSTWGSQAYKNRPTTPSAMDKVKEAATKRNVKPRQSFKRGPMQDWQNAANAYGVRGDINPSMKLQEAAKRPDISSTLKNVAKRSDRPKFKRPDITIPSRPGPVDDVVGPNRPPLALKKNALKRRLNRNVGGPVTTAAKKHKKYGGM